MKDFSKLKLIRFYFEIFRVIIKIQYLYDVDIVDDVSPKWTI